MVVDPRPALIRPGLWLGGACNEQDLDWLRSAGITHIAQVSTEGMPLTPCPFDTCQGGTGAASASMAPSKPVQPTTADSWSW